jgi:predicted phage terminase large subunit-like protein
VAREPSIMCSGVGQTKVGLHYDLVVLDDVVSNKNIGTPEQINKTIDHYRLLLSILDPGKELVIVGTRYSYADLYGHIMEEEGGQFSIHRRSAYREDGSLLFPSVLTEEFLSSQKKSQGSQHFANQYLNSPVTDETAMFRRSWIKYYIDTPKNLRCFMLIDPASSQEKYSDYTGIVICGISPYNDIYVLEALQLKVTIGDMVAKVFDKVAEYGINEEGCVGLEVNANQMTYKYIFSEEMNKRNLFFAIKELRPNSVKSKASRIKGLQPYFENGKVLVKKSCTELIDQISLYPRTRNDDLIDALANILEVMSPGTVEEKDKWEGTKLTANEVAIWKAKDDMGKKRMIKKTRVRM